ncbi:MAG: formylmethanofuran dehydrogenase subunit C [Candidatus Altiarchaeota archaeon]
MKTLTLTAKDVPEVGVEVDGLTPDAVAGKTIKQVRELVVYAGRNKLKAGDVFEVSGESAKKTEEQEIVFAKSTLKIKRIGENMSAGQISVEGDAGYHLGEYMSGGRIIVSGNAASWIGTCMSGGEIVVSGNAGSYVGASSRGLSQGVSGGKITVKGNAGTQVGVGLAGGELVIGGVVNDFLGSYMRGGKISAGGLDGRVGYAMSGGEITVDDKSAKPPLYFTKKSGGEKYATFEGDASFSGKGVLRIRR